MSTWHTYQKRTRAWATSAFGSVIAHDKDERNFRFLEEALELVQSMGCTEADAHRLVDYVYGRPVGEPFQEAGGVMVCLALLLEVAGIDMDSAAETELNRAWVMIDKIRAKQAGKPVRANLPVPS